MMGDSHSEATLLVNNAEGQMQPGSIIYGPEPQISNQLELQSMSEHNTVMGQRPVKVSRSSRSKIKKPTGDLSKKRPSQPDFDRQ